MCGRTTLCQEQPFERATGGRTEGKKPRWLLGYESRFRECPGLEWNSVCCDFMPGALYFSCRWRIQVTPLRLSMAKSFVQICPQKGLHSRRFCRAPALSKAYESDVERWEEPWPLAPSQSLAILEHSWMVSMDGRMPYTTIAVPCQPDMQYHNALYVHDASAGVRPDQPLMRPRHRSPGIDVISPPSASTTVQTHTHSVLAMRCVPHSQPGSRKPLAGLSGWRSHGCAEADGVSRASISTAFLACQHHGGSGDGLRRICHRNGMQRAGSMVHT